MVCKREEIRKARVLMLLVLGLFSLAAVQASAQSQRRVCPALHTGASEAEHALCWFDKDERGSTVCKAEKEPLNECILQTLQWCTDAALDAAPVANACFMANIRAARFDEAIAIAEYLQSPPKGIEKCREALTLVTVRIVSIPSGAHITVNDRSYGKAPVEVKLTGDWRKSRIEARFGSGADTVRAVASTRELVSAFDRSACVMGDLIIKPSQTTPSSPVAPEPQSRPLPPPMKKPAEKRPPESSIPSQQELVSVQVKETPPTAPLEKTPSIDRDQDDGGIYVPGAILAGVGAAGAIASAVILVMVEFREDDLLGTEEVTTWSEVESDYESLSTQRIAGWAALGGSVALGVLGAVLMVVNADGQNTAETAGFAIPMIRNGIGYECRF